MVVNALIVSLCIAELILAALSLNHETLPVQAPCVRHPRIYGAIIAVSGWSDIYLIGVCIVTVVVSAAHHEVIGCTVGQSGNNVVVSGFGHSIDNIFGCAPGQILSCVLSINIFYIRI
jgi:hypothetical protein